MANVTVENEENEKHDLRLKIPVYLTAVVYAKKSSTLELQLGVSLIQDVPVLLPLFPFPPSCAGA